MRAALKVLMFMLVTGSTQAQETDFSCMSFDIKPKQQVSERYIEYDISVRNSCPGAVHWAACVQTVDPWSHKIYTPLEPTGMVDKDKRSKINVQMKKVEVPAEDRYQYQKFYVNVAYSLEPGHGAQCMARSCEALKSEIRSEVRANDQKWQGLIRKVENETIEKCPKTNWNAESQEACISSVEESYVNELQAYQSKLKQLETQLENVDPVNCQVYGGY